MRGNKSNHERNELSRFNLIAARESKGLSVEAAARILNYSVIAIRNAENGHLYSGKRLYKAGEEFFIRASKLYGVPVDILKKRGRE